MQILEKVQKAAMHIVQATGAVSPDAVGVVLGTGLGGWCASLESAQQIPYDNIPSFPRSTVESHAGALLRGGVADREVLALSGRFHLYEGYESSDVCFGVRVLAALGIKRVILTNAAGALHPQFEVGGLMLITDHINMTGVSPLRGENGEGFGPRFPDLSAVYSPLLRDLAMQQALSVGERLEQGVYVQVMGPQLETPAETRAYRMLGGDAIGMSTAIEAVALRQMGVEVLGISCLTNKNLPDCMVETSLEDVVAQSKRSTEKLIRVFDAVIPNI